MWKLGRMAVKIADSLASKITLNDGVEMPLFGLGVFLAESADAQKATSYAVKHGYRMIDTAVLYKNEEDVGKAVKNCGVKREDLFIVTKCWTDEHGTDNLRKGFLNSLKRLDMDYVDLYLIHSPSGGQLVDTYKVMLQLKKEGLVRSVGVSNFGIQHFEGLKAAELPTPSVNQIELHPWWRFDKLVKYCREHSITVMGFSPLAKGRRFDDEDIKELAQKYGKSTGQMMIRWSVQSGFITIPKSIHEERIIENSQVFDWSISDEDFNRMNSTAEQSVCKRVVPEVVPWEG